MTGVGKLKSLVWGLLLLAISGGFSHKSRAVGSEPESVTVGVLLAASSDRVREEMSAYLGAVLGVEEANVLGGFFGTRFKLSVVHVDAATDAVEAATRLMATDRVAALISNLDDDAFLALRPVVQEAEVLLLNCSARADRFRTRSFPLMYHIDVSDRDYLLALGRYLVSEKNHRRWFLVREDDSEGEQWEEMVGAFLSRVGGEVADSVALSGQPDGEGFDIKREKLEDSGASLVVVGLGGERRMLFMELFGRLGSSLPLALVHEANADDVPWVGTSPVYWPSIWSHTLVRYSGRELNSRYRRRFDSLMDSDAWSNWAAVKLVAEAVIHTRQTNGQILNEFLESQPPFDGHKGAALTFDLQRRQLCHTLYVLENRTPVDEHIENQLKVVSLFQMVSSNPDLKPIGVK